MWHWLAGEVQDPTLCIDRGVSYALALAIGHPQQCIALSGDNVQVSWMDHRKFPGGTADMHEQRLWRTFDYRDPAISWAIARHYECFPRRREESLSWYCQSRNFPGLLVVNDHGPEEAVAQLVVSVAEKCGGVWRL